VRDRSRREFARIIDELVDRGAEGIILGCTEISMLVQPDDAPVKLFDTTEIHARRAATLALG
jgi:aspartate racemase